MERVSSAKLIPRLHHWPRILTLRSLTETAKGIDVLSAAAKSTKANTAPSAALDIKAATVITTKKKVARSAKSGVTRIEDYLKYSLEKYQPELGFEANFFAYGHTFR